MRNRTNLIHKLLATALVGIAFGLMFAFIGEWAINFTEKIGRPRRIIPQKGLNYLPDGTPLVSTQTYEQYGRMSSRKTEDLDGNEVELPASQKYLNASRLRKTDNSFNLFWYPDWRFRIQSFRDDSRQRVTYWYLIHDGRKDGAGYFVGYDVKTNEIAGYFGMNGFQYDKPKTGEHFRFRLQKPWDSQNRLVSRQNVNYGSYYPNNPIAEDDDAEDIPYSFVYLRAETGLYRIDLQERDVELVPTTEDVDIYDAALLEWYDADGSEKVTRIVIRTENDLKVFDRDAETLQRLVVPEALRDEEAFMVFRRADDSYFASIIANWKEEAGRRFNLVTLYELNGVGRIEEPREIRLDLGAVEPWSFSFGGLAGSLSLGPLLVDTMAFVIMPVAMILTGQSESYFDPYREMAESIRKDGLTVQLFSVLFLFLLCHAHGIFSAWYCWKRETRYGSDDRERKVWTAVCFLFGIPALVGYLSHRDWPVLEACETCGAGVAGNKETCSSCGEERRAPETRGIEIFA